MHLQRTVFLDWPTSCTVCSNIAAFSTKCCTTLKEILQRVVLLHYLHRHVALAYSKHVFRIVSSNILLCLQRHCTFWGAFWKSHCFQNKTPCPQNSCTFWRTYCKSWCCMCFTVEQSHLLTGFCSGGAKGAEAWVSGVALWRSRGWLALRRCSAATRGIGAATLLALRRCDTVGAATLRRGIKETLEETLRKR